MSKHQLNLARFILEFLQTLDGGQAGDVKIHDALNERTGRYVPLVEINEVLELCDRNGWIITVSSKFKGNLRSLSDDGLAALRQMK